MKSGGRGRNGNERADELVAGMRRISDNGASGWIRNGGRLNACDSAVAVCLCMSNASANGDAGDNRQT